MIINRSLLTIIINSLIFGSYQKSNIRPTSEILNQFQIHPNISATPSTVFTLIKKIHHPGVLTFPDQILNIIERIHMGYELIDEEIKSLKLCRITAGRLNGQIKDLHDNTFLGYLRFDTNKLTFRGCGTVLGMKGDGLPFSKAVATTVIEIDHLGGENATFPSFPKLELLTVDQLTKQELRFFNFDIFNSTHHQPHDQVDQSIIQSSTQFQKLNKTGTKTSTSTEYKKQNYNNMINT
ncbi:secreted protein [Melampsora americana]|nr:secreted protein [Melampsora americana]